MKARLIVLAIAALSMLIAAGVAQAHVTVHPNALPADGFTVIGINVPSEEETAATVKLDVKFPNGVYSASPAVIPGWKSVVITKKLSKPVEVEPGESVSSRVDRIVFSGGRIGPERFLSFPVSIKVPDARPGSLLTFKAVQTYSNGDVVRWIGSPGSEEPAPQVLVRPASSPVLDYPAGTTAARQGMTKTLKGVVFGLPLAAFGAYFALRRRRNGE